MDAATRNHIRFRRSEIIRQRTKPRQGPQLPITYEQMVKEIDSAIAFSQSGYFKRDTFPPVVKVPTVYAHATGVS